MRSRDSISSTSFGSRCGRGTEAGRTTEVSRPPVDYRFIGTVEHAPGVARTGFRLIDVADGAVVSCFRCCRNVGKNRVNGAVTAITRVVGMLEIGAS